MRKLQVNVNGKWEYVFAYSGGKVITTGDAKKALPQKAIWAESDLRYFSDKFGDNEFRLYEERKPKKNPARKTVRKNPLVPGVKKTARGVKKSMPYLVQHSQHGNEKGKWVNYGSFSKANLAKDFAKMMHDMHPNHYWRVIS